MSQKSEKSEKDIQKFLNNLPIGIFELVYTYSTRIGSFTFINQTAKKIFLKCASKEELDTEFDFMKMLVDPELVSDNVQVFDRIQEKGMLILNNKQFLLVSKDGKQILVDTNIRAKMKEDIITVTGTIQESTKVIVDETMKSTQELLKIQKEMSTFHDFFDTFDALIMIVNEEGRVLFISPNVEDRFLYKPRSETIGKKFDEIFPKGQADFFLSHCLEAIEKNEIVTIEYHLPIDNLVRWFQSQAIPVQETNSESKKVVTIIRDITDLKTKTIEE
ncbi:MAG: PAS domain-containing protein [Candidatus Heimdallarchaeota archaeon]|nr:PAS domain-containing protein [Candidatus Heimdallarchaeota archaeon]